MEGGSPMSELHPEKSSAVSEGRSRKSASGTDLNSVFLSRTMTARSPMDHSLGGKRPISTLMSRVSSFVTDVSSVTRAARSFVSIVSTTCGGREAGARARPRAGR